MAREDGEVVDLSVQAKLEPLRSKVVGLVDRDWLRKLPDGRFTTRLCPRAPPLGAAQNGRTRASRGGCWACVTHAEERAQDACPLVHPYRLQLSTCIVDHLADLLRRHLKAIRARWRILPPGKIAVIVLAVLRHDQREHPRAAVTPAL
ncbi:hypothetical protein AB0O42_31570 [Streptomyces sp. NPDC089922]|uniref:hypothetical protein n=1 Tax=Streptomyces sp. NPDC089922 TaxID=3155189 RepID=UPI0034345640